ncbi:HIT family protein [Haladaptatus salinisoli]|uniref:HIT family protein n=1 Tax=Haladaptatus salinisoli TaxID=2884876 RepID=UPI001D0BBE74|nr:HIT domain-containing protein [Haladaptatus salinisoli]
MGDCVFCDIVSRDAPGSIVYEDDGVLAMMTLRPMSRGHTLVIPKDHAASLSELTKETGGKLFETGMDLAQAIRSSELECEGINFWLADGTAAGQEVFHVHLHVLPRYQQDGIELVGPRFDLSRSQMDNDAETIKKGLDKN